MDYNKIYESSHSEIDNFIDFCDNYKSLRERKLEEAGFFKDVGAGIGNAFKTMGQNIKNNTVGAARKAAAGFAANTRGNLDQAKATGQKQKDETEALRKKAGTNDPQQNQEPDPLTPAQQQNQGQPAATSQEQQQPDQNQDQNQQSDQTQSQQQDQNGQNQNASESDDHANTVQTLTNLKQEFDQTVDKAIENLENTNG